MQFKRIVLILLICSRSGNAIMDPSVPVSSGTSTLSSLETSTLSTNTLSTTTLSTNTPSTTTIPTNTPSTTTISTNTPSTTTIPTSSPPTSSPPTSSPPTSSPPTSSPPTSSPTSTRKPNPPHPTGMNWVVVDEETNITCIVVKLSATVVVPYETISGNVENTTIAMPGNATSNGTCNHSFMDDHYTQKISLQWVFGKSNMPNVLTFVFHKNMSSGNESSSVEWVFLSDVTLQVYLDSANFPNASREYVYAEHLSSNLHSVAVNNSYRCNSQESIEMDVQELGYPVTMHMAHLQMEAFRSSVNDKFNSATDCPADKVVTSDIVPIAVGCALAALVVIVLVAYLIGRRRARQRGYQSV